MSVKKKKHHRKSSKSGTRNKVKVKQGAQARTGQGGNAFAFNGSDVGVVRTDVNPS